MSADPPIPRLECRGLSKRFGASLVLDGVDLTLAPGEVHGLVGANGAGKSTLSKILAGAWPDHEGEVLIDGRPAKLASPAAARDQGIAMVYQELSGIGQLSVAENVVLGRQPVTRLGRIDWPRIRREAQAELAELDLAIDVDVRLDRYPLVVRQMVEIARGLHSGAKVLILDEPTSALSPPETRRLFELVARLKTQGVAVIFISHFLEDVLEICDRVTILRDGRRVQTAPVAELSKHAVVQAMLGHGGPGLEAGFETAVELPPRAEGRPRLSVRGLALGGVFPPLGFQIAPGECLGLYGFVGAGHQEVAHAVAGALRPTAGEVLCDDVALPPGKTARAVARGVVLVAADRAQTLVPKAEIYKNVTLAHLTRRVGRWLARRREIEVARPVIEQVGCRPPSPHLKAGQLSGGNQQKVVLAKWLLGPVRVLVLDEPTRGMDVGAKDEILALVAELRRQGAAVLLSSSEPELLLAHADRILVLRRGQITREFAGERVDKADLLRSA